MRAAPAFHVTVTRFGVWRGVVATLAVLTSSALIAWLMSTDEFVQSWLRLTIAACGFAVVITAAGLGRCEPTSLRWDTQCWQLGPASMVGEEPASGSLSVALDLGNWMLLKFAGKDLQKRERVIWLPIQRRGLESQWHALRCAVYCARPTASPHADENSALRRESQE